MALFTSGKSRFSFLSKTSSQGAAQEDAAQQDAAQGLVIGDAQDQDMHHAANEVRDAVSEQGVEPAAEISQWADASLSHRFGDEDALFSNTGDATIFDLNNSDVLYGVAGGEFLLGNLADDTLYAGNGEEILSVGLSNLADNVSTAEPWLHTAQATPQYNDTEDTAIQEVANQIAANTSS